MLLLLVAAAVAVYTTDGSGERALPRDSRADHGLSRKANQPDRLDAIHSPAKARRSPGRPVPVIETLYVEPSGLVHPAIEAQALRVQTGARNRLGELIADLNLADQQQLDIFPLLARSHPDYNGNLKLVGVLAGGPLNPLGKLAADQSIREHLDPDQQLELEIKSIEADVWWSDVIAHLEMDLKESTNEPLAAGTAPDHDPTPPKDPQPTPAAPAPSAAPHRGNNLFDLLENGGS